MTEPTPLHPIAGERRPSWLASHASQRQQTAKIWQFIFLASTIFALFTLILLFYNILNDAFGYVAIVEKVPSESLAINGVPIEEQTTEQLVNILKEYESAGWMRAREKEQPLLERPQAELLTLVRERVVEPEVKDLWTLTESIFQRAAIEQTVAEKYPLARLEFRSWLSTSFLTNPQNPDPNYSGVRTAILGSLWIILITILIALPIGVGAAVYLEEYATDNWFNRLIQTNIYNLAGVPSIIYGILGLAVFVRFAVQLTSGNLFGVVADPSTANGRTILSAALTLALLILPLIIINAQEAIRAVPNSLRQASYGLGATKWQTVWNHVLPNAVSGILTGSILAISRAIGETAPLVVIGASTFITIDPNGPFSKFTTLPIQIYQWASRPQPEFHKLAAAAILVLLALLLTLNATAILLRNRFARRL
jgi:phosphate transport system permease protein